MAQALQPSWRYWVSLIAAAVSLRALVNLVFLGSMPLVSDAASYAESAQDILAHFPGSRAYYWPPGMPYVLAAAYALFGTGMVVARLTTMLVDVLTVVAVTALAFTVLPDSRAARLTGWIAACYPPAIMMSGQPYAQQLAMLCLVVIASGLLLGFRRHRWGFFALAGAALGWGSLARPSMMSVGGVLGVLWVLLLGRSLRLGATERIRILSTGAVAFLLAAIVCVLPAMRHNASHGEGWTISINNEKNFFLGNNPYTPHYKTFHIGQRDLDALEPAARAYQQRFRERPDGRRAMMQEALRYIAAHPLITLWRTLNRIRAYWGFDYVMSRQIQRSFDLDLWGLCLLLSVEAGGYVVLMILALVGLLRAWRAGAMSGGGLVVLLILAYYAPYTLAYSGGTFRFPVMGLLMPFAGAGLWYALSHWRELARDRGVWVVLTLFGLIQVEYAYHAARYASQ